jgi:hypothetical protein
MSRKMHSQSLKKGSRKFSSPRRIIIVISLRKGKRGFAKERDPL